MSTQGDGSGEAGQERWLGSLLLPAYFLVLIGLGVWLFAWGADRPAAVWVGYWAVLLVSLAGLFFRRNITVVLDRRNYIDLSRGQWLGRRGGPRK